MVYDVVRMKIAAMLLALAAGWFARRRGWLDGPSVAAMSRIVVDLAFPCLVFFELCRTLTPHAVSREWPLMAGGFAIVAAGMAAGRLVASDRTGAFLVGLPNWIFLPLLIVEPLYGDAGVRQVLLFNAGAQLALWTVGVGVLCRTWHPRALARNAGLVATVCGAGFALVAPGWAAIAAGTPPQGAGQVAFAVLLDGANIIGRISVPLSIFATGAQLAEVRFRRRPSAGRTLALLRVLVGRLVVVPMLVLASALGLASVDLVADRDLAILLVLIAGMPCAISGSLFVQRFGGDAPLASFAVLLSTVLSLLTTPAMVWLAHRLFP